MATTPTAPFPRLVPTAPSHPAARLCLSSPLQLAPVSLSVSLTDRRNRSLAAASKDTASSKGQGQDQEPAAAASADGGGAAETEGAAPAGEKSPEAVAAELKDLLRARKEAEAGDGGGWWAGVLQEMSEIEWPSPGRVVGTTGVVLGVIAGSTAALLSVNALLAELSDRVFAGRGLQDFFG